jgi:hypothetical protein
MQVQWNYCGQYLMLKILWIFMNFYGYELFMNSMNSRMLINFSSIAFIISSKLFMNNSWRCNELIIGQFIMSQKWWTFVNFKCSWIDHEFYNVHECVGSLFSPMSANLPTAEALSSQFMECKVIKYGYSQTLVNTDPRPEVHWGPPFPWHCAM